MENQNVLSEQLIKDVTQTELPDFYKTELNSANIRSKVFTILTGVYGALALTLVLSLVCTQSALYSWLLVILLPVFVILLSLSIISRNQNKIFKEEAAKIDFSNGNKPISINIQKSYKKLKTSYINVNWMCCLVYAVCILGYVVLSLLSVLIVIIGHTNEEFIKELGIDAMGIQSLEDMEKYLGDVAGDLGGSVLRGFRYVATPGMNNFFIAFLLLIFCFLLALFLHFWLITKNSTRAANMEAYYNAPIVPEAEINAIKKRIFIRDIIIFCLVTLIFGMIIWGIYRQIIYRRNLLTTAVPTSGIVPPVI